MYTVNLYGLVVESDWPLPECIQAEATKPADVRFLLGEVPVEGLLNDSDNPWVQTSDSACWINFEGVARFLISSGCEIRVQPYQQSDDPMLRLFLLGTALSVLLQQRGLLPIHGNAIEIDGACLVCVGDSGAGKSTLATAFLQQGFRLLADDVVPVDRAGIAWPGFPRIRLWGETASKFGIETTGLPRILPEMDKYQIPLGVGFCHTPLPVKWLYVLEAHDADTFEILPYEGMARFEPLHQNTYRVQYLEHFAMKSTNLQQVADLASKIHMAKIRRPKQGFRLQELVEFIMDDLNRHSKSGTSMRLSLQTKITRHPDMLSAEIGGEAVMMSIEKGAYFGLNSVATRIWDLIESPHTLGELTAIIGAEYDVEAEQCQQDVAGFVADMLEKGLAKAA